MTKLVLRPYQKEAIQGNTDYPGIHNFLYRDGNFAGMVILPTGGGKTFTAATYCEALRRSRKKAGKDLRIVWIAHRDELISQAAEAFRRINPKAFMTTWTSRRVVLDSGEKLPGPKDGHGDVIFAMVNSSRALPQALGLIAKSRKCQYFIVIDEAHHYAVGHDHETKYSNMYKRIMAELRAAHSGSQPTVDKLMGLSATPERHDKRPLGFDGIAYSISFVDLVERGYLARPELYEMRSNFYTKLDVRGGDFTQQSLERLNTPKRNMAIVQEILKNRWRYGKTLVFCCSRQHCQDMANMFKRLGGDLPVHVIDGTNSKVERKQIKHWLDEGPPREFKVLLNCMVYTEGFDCPTLNSVVLARPTMSETLWMQMVGRGARIVKARGTFPLSHFGTYPKAGQIGEFTLANDPAKRSIAKTLSIVSGTIPRIEVERIIKKKFKLTVVSDDITKYATLIKDWQLHIDPHKLEEEEERKKRRRKRRIKKVQEALATANKVEGTLSPAQLVDVQGILIISTLFHSRIGIPMDPDRMDSVRQLYQFAKGCWVDWVDHVQGCRHPVAFDTGKPLCGCPRRKIFDNDLFAQSYTFCVTAGQIPYQVWTKLQWAYYFHHIRGKQYVLDKQTGKSVRSWEYIEVARETDAMLSASRFRVERDLTDAKDANAKFNAQFHSRDAILKLFDEVFAQSLKDPDPDTPVAALNKVHGMITKIAARDRRIVCHTNIQIGGRRDKWIWRMAQFREAMTEAMQEHLDDSCCMVQAIALDSRLSQQEAHEFRRGKFAKQMGSPDSSRWAGAPAPGQER